MILLRSKNTGAPLRASLVLLVLLTAGGCVNREAQKQAERTGALIKDPTIPVSVTASQTRDLSDYLEITGETATSSDVVVGAKIGGRVVSVYVRDGDSVAAGQTVATLETSSQAIQLKQAIAQVSAAQSSLNQARQNAIIAPAKSNARLASAQAQVRSAKSQLQKAINGARPEERRQAENAVSSAKSNMDTAKQQADRARELWQAGAISKQQLEVAENSYQAALSQYQSALESLNMAKNWSRPEDLSTAQEAVRQAEEAVRTAQAEKRLDSLLTEQVQGARANLQAAQSQVNLIRQQMSDAVVRAPFSGRISGNPVQPGTVVSPGSPIARIIGSQGIFFEGEIPETALKAVRPGSVVSITISSLGARRYDGKVVNLSPSATSIGRLFKARIQFNTAPSEIRSGMFATGRVRTRLIPSATVVPSEAIVRRSNQDWVFVIEKDKAKGFKVTKGIEQDGWTHVTGLPPGSSVVTQGQAAVEEGAKVKIEAKPVGG